MRKRNWPLWSGLLLVLLSFVSYLFLFSRWPVTRDVPWVNYLLFAVAAALIVGGVRRAQRKVVPAIVAVFGFGLIAFFLFVVLVASKNVPASADAPKVGQKAPQFTLLDTNRKPVALSQLVAAAPKGVLLIFYRGYW